MSGKDETTRARALRRMDEERIEEGQQRRRRRRNNDIKRWTSKLGVIAISILICMVAYSFLIQPVNSNVVSTAVTGEGNFDKIVINRGPTDDNNIKNLFVIVEAPDNEYIAVPTDFNFYNNSIDFFITTHIEGIAQPSEHFILRTEGTTMITCKNNINISLTFGVIEDVVLPFIKANSCFGLFALFVGSVVIVFLGWIGWLIIDETWGSG